METPSSPSVTIASLTGDGNDDLRSVRASGWVLGAIGVILSTSMGMLIHSFAVETIHPLAGGGAVRWQGSREFTRTVFELYGSVFFFGLVCLAAGVYQVRTTKRSRWLTALLLLAAVGIVYFAWRVASTPTRTLLGRNVPANGRVILHGRPFCGGRSVVSLCPHPGLATR